MPYINQEAREVFGKLLFGGFEFVHPATPGELNYCFTMLAKEYIAVHGTNYQNINDVLGALEGAKLEFYRRVAAPYEESKRKLNGDVYT